MVLQRTESTLHRQAMGDVTSTRANRAYTETSQASAFKAASSGRKADFRVNNSQGTPSRSAPSSRRRQHAEPLDDGGPSSSRDPHPPPARPSNQDDSHGSLLHASDASYYPSSPPSLPTQPSSYTDDEIEALPQTPEYDFHTPKRHDGQHKARLHSPQQVQTDGSVPSLPTLPKNKHMPAVSDEENRQSQVSVNSGDYYSPQRQKPLVGPWELGISLGEGAAGYVRKGRHIATGDVVAIKSVSMKKARKQQTSSMANFEENMSEPRTRAEMVPLVLQREVTVMMMIDHPNIIRLYDVWENQDQLHMVMELVEGGELFAHIRDYEMDEHECARLFRQIISALQYCHRFQVCHRDLKPENILLDKNLNIKIADFGMAAMINGKQMNTACGSPHYAAPEVCRRHDYDGSIADAWSAGVVLYTMAFGTLPFASNLDSVIHMQQVIIEVCRAPLEFPAHIEASLELKAFLRRILQRDPDHRITIPEMWEHPWLQRYEWFAAQPENREKWLGGPVPALTAQDCGQPFTNRSQIDRSIVRSLCLLFNHADIERYVDTLMSEEPSYEKVLYHKLETFSEENRARLPAFTLPRSTSDYHHMSMGTIQRSNTMVSLLAPSQHAGPRATAETTMSRQTSQFSIVVPPNRGLSTNSRATDANGTEASYDPFRSSKTQIAYAGQGYTKVDIGRGTSGASKGTSTHSRVQKIRVPSSSVFQSVGSGSIASLQSSIHDYAYDDSGQVRTLRHTGGLRGGLQKRTMSTTSLATTTSNMTTASSARFVRSRTYKRSVSFVQRQKMQPPRPSNPTPGSIGQAYLPRKLKKKIIEVVSVNDKPEIRLSHHEMDEIENELDRREASLRSLAPDNANLVEQTKTPFRTSHHGKQVEQADPFIDSSSNARPATRLVKRGSNARAAAPQADQPGKGSPNFEAYVDERFGPNLVPVVDDTTPTRTSHVAPDGRPSSNVNSAYEARALPEPPFREPEALTRQRELFQQLQKFKEMAKTAEPGALDNVMNEIERLMRENAPRIAQANYERRISSAPAPSKARPCSGPDPLAVPASLVVKRGERDLDSGRRHVSDPYPAHGGAPTIRLVPDNLIPAPLNIKPRASVVAENADGTPMVHAPAMAPDARTFEPRVVPNRKDSLQPGGGFSSVPYRPSSAMSAYDPCLHTIEESHDQDEEEPVNKRSSASKFFRNPFKSARSSKSLEKENSGPSLHAKAPQPALRRRSSEQTLRPHSLEQTLRPRSSQPALRQSSEVPSARYTSERSHFAHSHPANHPATVELWKTQVQASTPPAPSSQSFAGTRASSEFPHRGDGHRSASVAPTSKKLDVLKNLFAGDRRSKMTIITPSVISEGDEVNPRHSKSSQHYSKSTRTSRDSGRDEGKHIQLLQPGARSLLDEATSWFARVLKGYQPKDMLFPFEVNRSRAMKAIKSVLLSWESYGVKDIKYSKARGHIFARLDKMNPMGFKPVQLMIEVFVVIDGERSHNADGLSVARLERIKGSRRTFKKCGKEMSKLLSARTGLLVRDKSRAALMKAAAKDVKKLFDERSPATAQ